MKLNVPSFGNGVRCLRGYLIFLLIPCWTVAATLRVATFNVENGIGAAGTEKGDAQRAILHRVNADLVAFQELNRKSSNEWARLAVELNYPHRVWGEMGPFAGSMVVGYFSRFPIVESGSVPVPGESREMSRIPLRITVQSPDSAQPVTLWNMHHKAMFQPADDFRRAIEAFRIIQDIERMAASHPEQTEFIVLGDMNDDTARDTDPKQSPQSAPFHTPPDGLPKSYKLGADIAFPVPYRPFPLDVYQKAKPGFRAVTAYREGGTNIISHLYTQYRLDYVFISEAIFNHPDGPPVGEIYHSESDAGGGLPKQGAPLPRGTSLAASDHYVVFADIPLKKKP